MYIKETKYKFVWKCKLYERRKLYKAVYRAWFEKGYE